MRKRVALGAITGIALAAVLGTSTMFLRQNDTQASEEYAAQSSIKPSVVKVVDPLNGVFVDESAVELNTVKLIDPANGVYLYEPAVDSRTTEIEASEQPR